MSSYISPIEPVAIFPGKADTLKADAFFGFPPSYRWSLGETVITPAKNAVGNPDEVDYQPPVPESSTYNELRAGNDAFTDKQWVAWTTQSDDSYVLEVVSANLGVLLKK